MSPQSNEYKNTQKMDALGDMPGADLARDLLKVSIDDQTEVLTTELAESLASKGGDSLLVEQASGATFDVEPSDGATFQVDQAGTFDVAQDGTFDVAVQNWQTDDPATESSLTSRQAREFEADDGDGNYGAVYRDGNALLVAHDGVLDVSSRDDRNLGDVDVTDLPDEDDAELDQVTLAADATETLELSATGTKRLRGAVVSTGTYDVVVSWQTAGGTEVTTTEVATGATAGEATTIDEPALSPHAVVQVTDTSSSEQTTDGTAQLT